MAYIKYKELTQFFNFFDRIDPKDLPKYVMDYIEKDEEIYMAYRTYRDKGVFTNKKVIVFDKKGFIGNNYQITMIPYSSVSSMAILYRKTSVDIVMYLDNSYPLKLRFIKTSPQDKTNLRIMFFNMSTKVMNR